MPVKTLGDFILQEMNRRHMTGRQFADLLGTTHTTVNRFLNHGIRKEYAGKAVGTPSVGFLAQLAKATNTDICTLMALVVPDVVRATNMSVDAELLGQQIEHLPDNVREVLGAMIEGSRVDALNNNK